MIARLAAVTALTWQLCAIQRALGATPRPVATWLRVWKLGRARRR